MVGSAELNELLVRAWSAGARLTIKLDERAKRDEGRSLVDQVSIAGLAGVGPFPMGPIAAAECLRELALPPLPGQTDRPDGLPARFLRAAPHPDCLDGVSCFVSPVDMLVIEIDASGCSLLGLDGAASGRYDDLTSLLKDVEPGSASVFRPSL